MITFGLPKGYLFKKSIDYFRGHGIEIDNITDRQLVFYDKTNQYRFLILRPIDVPVYVENGIVDIGVTGMDILNETKPEIVTVKDLGFGYCRFR